MEMQEFTGETFFSSVIAGVSDPNSIPFFSHRELENITLKILVAGTELNTFMDVSAPSNNVNQEKPAYTNIENGLGIFSSREAINWEASSNFMGSSNGLVNINSDTIKKLKSLGLGFCFSNSGTSGYACP